MGNWLVCAKRGSSKNVAWDGEEFYWESPALPPKRRRGGSKVMCNHEDYYDNVENGVVNVERQMLLDDQKRSPSPCLPPPPPPFSREVKVKLTRKELENLVIGVEVRALSLEEVLAKLLNNGNAQFDQVECGRSWRPVLQSIPEVNSELSC